MELNQTEKNRFLKIATKYGFNASDFIVHSTENYDEGEMDTIFRIKSEGFYFWFKKNIPNYTPVDWDNFKEYIAEFSPGEVTSSDEVYMKSYSEYEQIFTYWLKNIKKELKARNEFEEIVMNLELDFSDEKSPWTEEDSRKSELLLEEFKESVKSLEGSNEGLIKKISKQNDLILKEIEEIKEERVQSGKILAKNFVLQAILGSLISIATESAVGYGQAFANSLLQLIFSKTSLLESVPAQSVTT